MKQLAPLALAFFFAACDNTNTGPSVEYRPDALLCESHVYAACYATGHVAKLSTCSKNRVALAPVGDRLQALGGVGGLLLATDDGAQQLLRLDAQTLEAAATPLSTGANPTHVLTRDAYVYVVNANSNTLQIFDTQNNPLGDWQTAGEFPFGKNTSPQALAFAGDWGFVPLYGNLAGGETGAGQRLVRLNFSNPHNPSSEGEADFSSLKLNSPEKTSLPLPYDVVSHQGALYVALNNLGADFAPAGPGAVAKVDPLTLATSVISLGDSCTNVTSVASDGQQLAASCAGDWGQSAQIAGVALIENDKMQKLWTAPQSFTPGALTFVGDKLWVANANAGDVYVFSVEEQGLQLLRGEGGSEGGPIETCPQGLSGFSSVQSLLWLP